MKFKRDLQRGLAAIAAAGLICLVAVLTSPFVSVPAPAQSKAAAFTNVWRIKPQAMPSTLTDLASLSGGPPAGVDIVVCVGDVENKTAGSSTFTIQDNQASPVAWFPGVSLGGNSVYQILQVPGDQGCRYFPGGASVQAAAGNTMTFYLSGKY